MISLYIVFTGEFLPSSLPSSILSFLFLRQAVRFILFHLQYHHPLAVTSYTMFSTFLFISHPWNQYLTISQSTLIFLKKNFTYSFTQFRMLLPEWSQAILKTFKASPIVYKFWKLEFHLKTFPDLNGSYFCKLSLPLTLMYAILQNIAPCFSDICDGEFAQICGSTWNAVPR